MYSGAVGNVLFKLLRESDFSKLQMSQCSHKMESMKKGKTVLGLKVIA